MTITADQLSWFAIVLGMVSLVLSICVLMR